jgi:hypothetical protein
MCVPCHDQASYIAAYTMNWPFKNMLPGSVDGSPSLRALRNCGSSLAKPSAQPQIKCWSLFPGPAPRNSVSSCGISIILLFLCCISPDQSALLRLYQCLDICSCILLSGTLFGVVRWPLILPFPTARIYYPWIRPAPPGRTGANDHSILFAPDPLLSILNSV